MQPAVNPPVQPGSAPPPVLATERLVLRPFTLADAPEVQVLAGAREIADTTLTVPHPYPEGAAEQWIRTHEPAWQAGSSVAYAIADRATAGLLGCIALKLDARNAVGELGYWIGVPFWGHGYTTEAARALTVFAFESLLLNRVQAHHFVRNPASGRVLVKIGMTYEGTLRQAVRKWGTFEDIAIYGVLASEWQQQHTTTPTPGHS